MNRNLVLIGFMGSGKTTVGLRLAAATGRVFMDTDGLIEEYEGKTVQEIFAEKGEDCFREAEVFAAKKASSAINAVIATGGGMVKMPEAMAALKKTGTVIYLEARPRDILLRTSGDRSRPLLLGADRHSRVTALLKERLPLYEKYADIKIVTSGKTLAAVLGETLEAIEIFEKGAEKR